MQTCKEVIDLASRRLDSKLTWWENVEFLFHLMMCRTCARYTKQLAFLRRASSQLDKQFHDAKLSLTARKRILHELSKQQTKLK